MTVKVLMVDGLPRFYIPGVNDPIPAGTFDISDADWQKFLGDQTKYGFANKKLVELVPVPPVDPPVDNYALRTSKVVFFRRCTDVEAAQFVADLTEASPRLKAIFDSVTYLIPGSDEYPSLRAAVEARVTSERADELLAPSND